ncbi:MAG: cyclic nucleotide-binding domain-containing protein [bacterium]
MSKKETNDRYQWILGPKKAAVKKKSSRIWYITDLPDNTENVPFGLALSLARPDIDLSKEPSSSNVAARIPLRLLACPLTFAWILLVISAAIAIVGIFKNHALLMKIPVGKINTWSNSQGLLIGGLTGYLISILWQASLLLDYCRSKKYVFGLGGFGIVVEPVIWRLGIPFIGAFFSLLLPVVWAILCWAWMPTNPLFFLGYAIGFWIYIIVALFPLQPGPGTRLMEKVFQIEDLPQRLRWAIASRFLPAGQCIETGTEATMSWAAFSLVLWIIMVGITFLSIHVVIKIPLSLAGLVLDTIISAAAVCFAFWFIFKTIELCQTAFLLRGQKRLQPMTISANEQKGFDRKISLFTLLPELAELPWQWNIAPAGAFLIRYGERDRTFYWFASGEASILGRTPTGDVVHIGTLHGDTGIGEVAFLDDRPRIADVLITKSALVASITYQDFSSIGRYDFKERFRSFILTGQAFELSQVFSDIPDKEKQVWIKHGVPVRYKSGDIIIEDGHLDQWIALLIIGEVEVIKNYQSIDMLHVGDVLGEIAFLNNSPREATLRAVQDILLWRWDPEWLNQEVDRIGLRPILAQIANKRQRV